MHWSKRGNAELNLQIDATHEYISDQRQKLKFTNKFVNEFCDNYEYLQDELIDRFEYTQMLWPTY